MPSLDTYDPIFAAAGAEWNVDPAVLKAIAAQESGGDPGAVSKAGAQGLMGIIPSTQKYLGVTDPRDPTQSIYGGAKYLAEALTNEGENPAAALSYYHGGPGWRGAYGPEWPEGYVPAVAAHYAQYAKANTGSMTDASPAAAPDYNNPPAAVAPQAPAAAPAPATPAPAADPFTAALTGGNKPPPAAPTDDPFTKALGTPKEAPVDKLAEAISSPEALAADVPQSQAPAAHPPASLEDLRDRIQKGDINILKSIAPGPDAGPVESFARKVAMTGVHLGANLLIQPINQAIGLQQGPSGAATWNPATGTFGITPEAQAVASVFGRPLRFSGKNPLQFEAPGTFDQKPIPPDAAPNLLSPDAAAKIGSQGAVVPPPAPAIPTPFNKPTEAPAVAQTGVPVTPPPRSLIAAGTPPGMSAEDSAWLKALPTQVQELVRENAEAGGPQSLSAAATPPSSSTLTPAQARSYRTMAELHEILSPIEGADYTTYTPGVTHTLAEHEGNPLISQQETLLRQRAPEKFDTVTQPANKAMVNAFDQEAGTSVGAQTLREQMQRVDETNHTAVMAASAGKSADLEHVASQLDDFLNDPLNNKRDAVRKVLVPLREAMNDANGELETNPRAVWGMWSNVKDKLDVASTAESSAEHAVQNQLLGLKKGLGDELNRVSSGKFEQLNQQHGEMAKQLSAMQILQKKQGTLTNRTTGMINGDAFHRWLVDLAQRRGRPGIDPSMDLPDSTMRTLINIDNDLKLNSRIDLGKARGSPTNLYFEVARAMGLAGVHGLTAAMTGGPGIANMVVGHGMNILGSRIGNIRLNQQVRRHLPPPEGWNALQQPPLP